MAFIVLDGPDGAGKTTQVTLLAEHLKAKGHRVLRVREPGGTEVGEKIRSILLDANETFGLRAELLLYMASRAELVQEVIIPALHKGQIVLSDRFVLSSVAYQGLASGLGEEAVESVARLALGGLEPDLTVLLDIDEETALARWSETPDRIESRDAEYHRKVREGFANLAKRMLDVRVVDGRRSIEEIHVEIRKLADDVCG